VYRWIVFVHVLSALVFFMGHGASAAMAFRLRHEQNTDRIRAMLELATALRPLTVGSLLLLLVAGIAAGTMGNWWTQGWISISLLLLIVLGIWMSIYTARYYTPLRMALGLKPKRDRQANTASAAREDEIATLVKATNPWALAVPGLALTCVILWLMLFKPF
jgi:uncharacterized membrane protein